MAAHDTLIAATHRAQADALEIEAQAKRLLADEYDAAQERGEARTRGGDRTTKLPDGKFGPSDIGLSDRTLHEARQIRDAERERPGIVRQTLDAKLAAGEEPNRAARSVSPTTFGLIKGNGGKAAPGGNPRSGRDHREAPWPAAGRFNLRHPTGGRYVIAARSCFSRAGPIT